MFKCVLALERPKPLTCTVHAYRDAVYIKYHGTFISAHHFLSYHLLYKYHIKYCAIGTKSKSMICHHKFPPGGHLLVAKVSSTTVCPKRLVQFKCILTIYK